MLILNNYKEPLTPVQDGFGYLGTLAARDDGSALQCHICGAEKMSLALHVRNAHKISADEYRQRFELSPRTSLVSPELSLSIGRRFALWKERASKEEKDDAELRRIKSAKPTYRNWTLSLETRNKRGNCPEQLLDKIRTLAVELQHTPTVTEFTNHYNGVYYSTIMRTFGSYKEAVRRADLAPVIAKKKVSQTYYTPDMLLDYLKQFKTVHGRTPTSTDCRRGLLPRSDHYSKRWGSFSEARKAAGL